MTVWSFTILTMAPYTSAERLIIVKTFNKNNDSPMQTFRALREIFGPRNRPSTRVITRIMSNHTQRESYSFGPKESPT